MKRNLTVGMLVTLAACGGPVVPEDSAPQTNAVKATSGEQLDSSTNSDSGSNTSVATPSATPPTAAATPSASTTPSTSPVHSAGKIKPRSTAVRPRPARRSTPAPIVPAPTPLTYALRVTDAHYQGVDPIWADNFVINNTYTLYFATDINGTFSGHHTLSLLVDLPGGGLYQRYDVSFAAGVTPETQERTAERTPTGYRVWVSMPVAGTWIQTFNLAGAWMAYAYVDGSLAANATAPFRLQ